MKSVLISIQPKWCELIANGKKTIEVRKTKPKLETHFKVYIYMTKEFSRGINSSFYFYKYGKVIGEFVCDDITDCRDINMDFTCLTVDEWLKYTKGHKGAVWGWHISNLVIYDKPRELSEFRKECKLECDMRSLNEPPCEKCEHLVASFGSGRTITRPPQSWCYVESEVQGE